MSKLIFYYSSMTAGKTTILIQINHKYKKLGLNTFCFLPEIIAYRTDSKIRSRIGIELDCEIFDINFNFKKFLLPPHKKSIISGIFIDEAEFLTKDQIWQLCDLIDNNKISVYTFGLLTDFKGETFEGSKTLFSLADELKEIPNVCYCGSNATMSIAFNKNKVLTEYAQLSEKTYYIPVCRKHFKKLIKKKYIGEKEKIFATK